MWKLFKGLGILFCFLIFVSSLLGFSDIRLDPFTEEDQSIATTDEQHVIPSASPFYITLDEVPRYDTDPVSTVFVYQTDILEEAITDSATVEIVVGDTTLWAENDVIKVEDEQMLIDEDPTGDTYLHVERGYNGTTATLYDSGTRFKSMASWDEVYTIPSAGEFQVHYGTDDIPYKRGMVRFHENNAGTVVWVDYYKTGSYNWIEDNIHVVNVKRNGAQGDEINDDAYAFINAYTNEKGSYIYLPNGTYLIGTTLNPPSNTHFIGEDRDLTIIREHSSLGANRIFHIQGTADTHKSNISFENLTIRNGTATTDDFTIGKDGIRAEYVDDLTIKNCKITEIEGGYGLVTKYSTNITIKDSYFYRGTYALAFFLIETENIHIDNCIFDTLTSTTAEQTYSIGTGGESLSEGTFGVKNMWVTNCTILNNPRWEGLDTHGGENFWFINNYIENVYIGINAAAASGFWSYPTLKNVHIKGNKIIQGNGNDGASAIQVKGLDWNIDKDIYIEDNNSNGFGSSTSTNYGAITLYYLSNVKIKRNTIEEFKGNGICLYYALDDVVVEENYIKNAAGDDSDGISSGIRLRTSSLYRVFMDKNTITYSTSSKNIQYGIRSATKCNAIVGGHDKIFVSTTPYSEVNTGYSADPVSKIWGLGDDATDTALKPIRWVSPASGLNYGLFGWFAISLTVDATITEYKATLTTADNYVYVPRNANVIITGAGAGGTNLTTVVLKSNIDGTLILKHAIGTSVTGAAITMVTPTFTQ